MHFSTLIGADDRSNSSSIFLTHLLHLSTQRAEESEQAAPIDHHCVASNLMSHQENQEFEINSSIIQPSFYTTQE
jgi:hypothetical protein